MRRPDSNSLRRELAQSRPAGAHLDADVLSAFAEGSLLPRERERALAHLAACAHCREVLSVASSAAPEPVVVTAPIARPARGFIRRSLPWLSAAAALLVISSALLMHHWRPTNATSANRESAKLEQRPLAPVPLQPSEAAPSPAVTRANRGSDVHLRSKTTLRPPSEPATAAKAAPSRAAPPAESGAQSAASKREIADANGASSTVETVVDSTAAALQQRTRRWNSDRDAVASQLGNAPARQSAAGKTQEPLGAPPSAAFSKASPSSVKKAAEIGSVRPQWRINEAGQLERAFRDGIWEPIAMPGTSKLHVVSVAGSELWAGGEHSRLEHSSDNGTTWTSIQLPSKNGHDHTISHIRFANSQKGSVEASDGTSWRTTDGGRTWN